MNLIYVALLCEGQAIIEKYKLSLVSTKPYRIYANQEHLVVIGGVGDLCISECMAYLFANFSIARAFNIGIAGSGNVNDPIGSFFVTNRTLDQIPKKDLRTLNAPNMTQESSDFLYDMEGNSFLNLLQNYLTSENIFVFKVVSDHNNQMKLSKDEIKMVIRNTLPLWEKFLLLTFNKD